MSLGWREQHTQPAPAAPAEAKPPDGKNSDTESGGKEIQTQTATNKALPPYTRL